MMMMMMIMKTLNKQLTNDKQKRKKAKIFDLNHNQIFPPPYSIEFVFDMKCTELHYAL